MSHQTTTYVDIPLIDPQPSRSFCSVGGVRHYYTNWELPATITKAIGVGCACGTFGTLGGVVPVAECYEHPNLPGVFVAVRVRS